MVRPRKAEDGENPKLDFDATVRRANGRFVGDRNTNEEGIKFNEAKRKRT
jgi:hypothetical protein